VRREKCNEPFEIVRMMYDRRTSTKRNEVDDEGRKIGGEGTRGKNLTNDSMTPQQFVLASLQVCFPKRHSTVQYNAINRLTACLMTSSLGISLGCKR